GNSLIESGVNNAHRGMKQTGPEEWRDDAAKQHGAARQNRQYCAIEQSDQQGSDHMNDRCNEQALPVERGDIRSTGVAPVRDPGAAQEVHRIPDTVVCNESIHQCWKDHGNAACDTAFDSSLDRICFDWQVGAMPFTVLNVLNTLMRRQDLFRRYTHRHRLLRLMR